MTKIEFIPFPKLTTLEHCDPGALVHSLETSNVGPALVVEPTGDKTAIVLLSASPPEYRVCSSNSPALTFASELYRVETLGEIKPFIGIRDEPGYLLCNKDGWYLIVRVDGASQAFDLRRGKIVTLNSLQPASAFVCMKWRFLIASPDQAATAFELVTEYPRETTA